ncbi:MAG TPA: hypothetical protein VMU04_11385 [Candidatus Acidoferrum sp.]|nr:hypothetical protein [Candidatus Acidoferrum sp.]
MKPTPKLDQLAEGCWNGACNVSGILLSLGEAVQETEPCTLKAHPALPIILGQVASLIGGEPKRRFDFAGPDPAAIQRWKRYRGEARRPL